MIQLPSSRPIQVNRAIADVNRHYKSSILTNNMLMVFIIEYVSCNYTSDFDPSHPKTQSPIIWQSVTGF